jgi:hypothetical protein
MGSFGLSWSDCVKYYGLDEKIDHDGDTDKNHPFIVQEKINNETLLKTEAANELTSVFTKSFGQELAGETGILETGLYAWLRPLMFNASTKAFFGTRLLEVYPNLEPDFFEFDSCMLSMFFGIPKLFIPKAYNVRDRAIDGMENYNRVTEEESQGTPIDPNGEVSWEPIYGSRGNRARQLFYRTVDVTMRGRGSLDLGFLFGISSNSIPTTE